MSSKRASKTNKPKKNRYWKQLIIATCVIVALAYVVTFAALAAFDLSWEGEYALKFRHIAVIGGVMVVSFFLLWGAMSIMLRDVDRLFVDKNNRLRRIASATSHELRTPLTLMLANLDVLEMEKGQDELIDDMREEVLHMSHLVTKMVDLSRREEGEYEFKVENVNMSNLVRASLGHFGSLMLGREISVVDQIEENVWCETCEDEMKQVLVILLDNAIKYCDPNGKVSVRLTSLGRGHAVLCVENTFAACDPEEFDHFFDRFYRSDIAKAAAAGDGLGLPLAMLSVKRFGGDIEVYHAEADNAIGFKVTM